MVNEFDLTLTSVCAHANLLDPTSPDRYGTAEIIKAIKLAHFLGVKQVITTEGDPKTGFGHHLTDDQGLFSICEKPLGHTLAQSKALLDACVKHDRIFRYGTQQRSQGILRRSIELVMNGATGDIERIDIWDPKAYRIVSPGPLNERMSHPVRGDWKQS